MLAPMLILAGWALSGQEASVRSEPDATLPDVVVSAPAPATHAVVRVQCVLQTRGRLSNCRILSEEPRGMGFGEAALRAAERSRVSPGADAEPGARIEWNVRFRLDEPAALDVPPPRA